MSQPSSALKQHRATRTGRYAMTRIEHQRENDTAVHRERTALITGATRGLGLALARGLARRRWNLILTARDAERLRAVRDELAVITQVAARAGDITSLRHREALAVLAHGNGGLHAVVNNAGTLGPSPLPALLDQPLESLIDVLLVNVVAQLGVLQAVRAALVPGARIINVTSDAAVNAYAGWGGYGASKAALEQISAVLAAENADLRVYAVDPGDMRTDMQQSAYPGQDIGDRPLPEERVPAFIALLEGERPSGRCTAAELIAAGRAA
jgi:NAD(P)-dependent dehydrogenase (short-subunit alcohol dehydrogenase family)